MVIVWHWFDHNHWINRYIYNGESGVTLFFVLSGFLITGILLNTKQKVADGLLSTKNYYKIFYIRRTLRIFPVYYLLLLLLWLLQNPDFINGLWWHILYASNFHFYNIGRFDGSVSIFWSLSVEEQFYLFWPFLIIVLPLRFHLRTYTFLIFTAIIFRICMVTYGKKMGVVLMPAQLDSFGIGALLAYARIYIKDSIDLLRQKSYIILFFLLLVYLLIFYLEKRFDFDFWHFGFFSTVISLISGLIIISSTQPLKNIFLNRLLNNRILIYVGRISYGLYLYHNFIPYFYNVELPSILAKHSFWIIQMFRFLVLITVASVSWYLIEKPILRLKNLYSS